ncbi:MAG TPA: PAS domain S-box protein [Candidatus Binatia bacterium]|jgi:two-component system sensor kinase FixL|nr:PAS domain S-box protein [Candidatus Binatia bacterium]
MNDSRRSLTEQLIAVLQEHIAGGGEAALLRAYDLGRSAVTARLNVLEMLALQQDALVAMLLQRLGTDEGARLTTAAADVFAESLAPFELARRSSQEGTALLRHLNEELERQVAERTEELQRQRDFAESLIETARTVVLVLDLEGRIVRFNQYMEELSGYRLAEVQGKSWIATCIPERDRSRVQKMFAEAMQGPRTYHGSNSIVTRDGHEREIEWASTTLKDTSGDVLGLLSIGQDITERKRAQTLLQDLVRTAQDAIISIDQQGRIELFNPAAEQIFGYTRDEVVGQSVNMLMPEPYTSEHDEYIRHSQRTGELRAVGRTRLVTARRKSGEVFPIEISLAKIALGDEVTYGAFIRDISEKIKLQEQLLERERLAAIGTTAATFAHEVGNPLNSMYMSAQLLERRLAKQQSEVDAKAQVSLRNLMSEIKRLIFLLDEFRTLARRQKLALRPISLAAVVEDVLAVESLSYRAQGITVERSFPGDLPLVRIDIEKMKQVVLNLCKNAAEAMPAGGKLTVSAADSAGQVRLEISDTGGGIPAGVDIFEPFITTKPKGTGLGLTIVRQIIAAHNGLLTYHSTPGQGTTFTITLPVAPRVET